MAVRMKDIARDLGVSVGTVSKVFNHHLDISPVTRERVLRRMRELNYRPSLEARGLSTGGDIEYADEITLSEALTNRKEL